MRPIPPVTADETPNPPADSSAWPRNHTSLRLWMTSGDVLARTHYDKSHNVLCVLRGRKKVVLWPPDELPALHLYPAVHAAHRQSQVSPLRLEPARQALLDGRAPALPGVVGDYPLLDAPALLGARGALRAELGEGDCMYTPPYWAHSVLSALTRMLMLGFFTTMLAGGAMTSDTSTA